MNPLQQRESLERALRSAFEAKDWKKAEQLCRDLRSAPPLTDISIVAPVYNETDGLIEFHSRLASVLDSLNRTYEIILIDDGSDETTKRTLDRLLSADHRLTVIELSRNFGHQMAISAGLNFAGGDVIVIMDSDLQDPPETLPEFFEKIEEGYDVVYGIRKNRKENIIKKLCYASFYRLLKQVSNIEIPLDAGDFCVLRREAAEHLRKLPERNRFVRGMRSWVGFQQAGITYDRDKRYAGKPKFTIRRLVKLALDGIFSFSYRPLRAISLAGIAVSAGAFLLALFYAFQRIKFGLNPPGFASTMVAIFFFSGLQLTTLGIIGEYIGRIYEEVKQRPLYIIRAIKNGPTNSSTGTAA